MAKEKEDEKWLMQLLLEVDIAQKQAAINDKIIFNY